MSAPVVQSYGEGKAAQLILEIAKEYAIPIKEGEEEGLLSLLKNVQPGTEIPDQLYMIVARIFAYFLQKNDRN